MYMYDILHVIQLFHIFILFCTLYNFVYIHVYNDIEMNMCNFFFPSYLQLQS